MSTWRYGIIQLLDGSFCMAELFLADAGQVEMMSEPMSDYYESREELIDDLKMMLEDAEYYPVFVEPEVWEEPDWLKDLDQFAGGQLLQDFLDEQNQTEVDERMINRTCCGADGCTCSTYPYLN